MVHSGNGECLSQLGAVGYGPISITQSHVFWYSRLIPLRIREGLGSASVPRPPSEGFVSFFVVTFPVMGINENPPVNALHEGPFLFT